jgi:hypothetical protein
MRRVTTGRNHARDKRRRYRSPLLDWRKLRASRTCSPPSDASAQARLTRTERDHFFWLAYSADDTPGRLLRGFVEAYADGAPVPLVPELGEPGNKRQLIAPSEMVFNSFAVPRETVDHAYRRARSTGYSLSGVLQRFIVAHVRAATAASNATVERTQAA